MIPAKMMRKQSHQRGLNPKICEKANKAPVVPPIAAVCVEIFHQWFIIAPNICIAKAATTMLDIKCGICRAFMI
jgi:hypothetical protein